LFVNDDIEKLELAKVLKHIERLKMIIKSYPMYWKSPTLPNGHDIEKALKDQSETDLKNGNDIQACTSLVDLVKHYYEHGNIKNVEILEPKVRLFIRSIEYRIKKRGITFNDLWLHVPNGHISDLMEADQWAKKLIKGMI